MYEENNALLNLDVKTKIRRSFNEASETYENAADWQKEVGQLLLHTIKKALPQEKYILDLGCGTGFLLKQLEQEFPNNTYLALDIAESMLYFARQHLKNTEYLCNDAESLGLLDESIDIIFSNMMLQWSICLKSTLKEQHRVLKPSGQLIFSILGPNSLDSLKNAWQKIDTKSDAINHFIDQENLKDFLSSAGFNEISIQQQSVYKHYNSVLDLLQHLKTTGANTLKINNRKGLMGKQKINQLNQHYENPVCYEVYLVTCKK